MQLYLLALKQKPVFSRGTSIPEPRVTEASLLLLKASHFTDGFFYFKPTFPLGGGAR